MLKSDQKVVDFLARNSGTTKWYGTTAISKATEIDYRTTARSLKRLLDLGVVARQFGPRNSMLYHLVEKPRVSIAHVPTQPTSSASLFGALKVFQTHKLPKFIESGSYKAYAKSVAGLFKQAIDVFYGAAPDQSELDYYRNELILYKMELENHLRGINSILETEELWDATQSSGFIASGPVIELDELSVLVDRALKENQ